MRRDGEGGNNKVTEEGAGLLETVADGVVELEILFVETFHP